MAIKYYPLTRIKTDLYTRGGEFNLPDGKPYTGKYYTTYNNKSFSGINPALGTNEPLTAITPNTINITIEQSTYSAASSQNNPNITQSDLQLTQLNPYFPFPISTDYARGYFTRYFAKTVTGPGYVIEISPIDWSKIKNGNVDPNMLGYLTTEILWQLTGPLNNTRVSQYQIIGGVYDTNKRTTEAAAVNFIGLLSFIGGNYTKFAKITPTVATSGSM